MTQETSLGKEIYEGQLENNRPGLAIEVKEVYEEIGINNINEKKVN